MPYISDADRGPFGHIGHIRPRHELRLLNVFAIVERDAFLQLDVAHAQCSCTHAPIGRLNAAS